MTRTQLYLPEQTYKKVKTLAKSQGMSFAAYVRICLDEKLSQEVNEDELYKDYPFLKYAGMLESGDKDAANNEKLDAFLYDF